VVALEQPVYDRVGERYLTRARALEPASAPSLEEALALAAAV
jgi:hypothetical protein